MKTTTTDRNEEVSRIRKVLTDHSRDVSNLAFLAGCALESETAKQLRCVEELLDQARRILFDIEV